MWDGKCEGSDEKWLENIKIGYFINVGGWRW